MLQPRLREAITESVREAIARYTLEELFRVGGVPAILQAIKDSDVPPEHRENLFANLDEAGRVIAAALGMM